MQHQFGRTRAHRCGHSYYYFHPHHDCRRRNRLLLVGVSMNITNSPTTGVVSVTYNGTTLNFLGAHNDAGDTRRVEMWYLLSPSTGNNLAVNVSIKIPAAGAVVGVVAVRPRLPAWIRPCRWDICLRGWRRWCVLAAGCPQRGQRDDPGHLATGGDQTVNVGLGPQVQQWNLNSGNTASPDVTGRGSTRPVRRACRSRRRSAAHRTGRWVRCRNQSEHRGYWSYNQRQRGAAGYRTLFTTSRVQQRSLGGEQCYADRHLCRDGLALVSVTPSAGTTCPTTAPTITCNFTGSLC